MAVGQQWKHNWIPLTPGAARQKNHGREVKAGSWVTKIDGASVHSGRKGSGVHRITHDVFGDSRYASHQYVSGPAADKMVERAASDKFKTVEHHITGHEKVLASAPKQLQQVWQAARDKGWSVSLSTFKRSDDAPGHRLQVMSPDGKVNHRLSWVDGKKTTYNSPTVKKVLADVNTHEPSKQMDDKIRSAVGKSSAPSAPQSKEDRFLAEARARESRAAAERQRTVDLYNQAQARQREAADAVARKQEAERKAAEQKAAEQKAQRLATEQKVRADHATDLSNQAARAYKAGDYDKALKLLDQAAVSDPSRADTFKSRRDRVTTAQAEAKATGKTPADVQRLREKDAARQAKGAASRGLGAPTASTASDGKTKLREGWRDQSPANSGIDLNLRRDEYPHRMHVQPERDGSWSWTVYHKGGSEFTPVKRGRAKTPGAAMSAADKAHERLSESYRRAVR